MEAESGVLEVEMIEELVVELDVPLGVVVRNNTRLL